jgi:hypothetical protein
MISAFLNVGLAMTPGAVSPQGMTNLRTTDVVRLFALDRRRVNRQRLVCRWRQDDDGRLSCIWEPDAVLTPRR